MRLDMKNGLLHVVINGVGYQYYQVGITLDGKGFRDWPGKAYAADTEEGWMDFYEMASPGCVKIVNQKTVSFRRYGKVVFTPNSEALREDDINDIMYGKGTDKPAGMLNRRMADET